MDSLNFSIYAGQTIHRMVVSTTLGLRVPPEFDVSPVRIGIGLLGLWPVGTIKSFIMICKCLTNTVVAVVG